MRVNTKSRATTAVLTVPLLVGCGGRNGDDGEVALQDQQGGASSIGTTTSTGLARSTGGYLSTGGTSSVNTSIVGCPGQPVARPAPFNAGHSGDCSGSQGLGQQVLGGISVSVLE